MEAQHRIRIKKREMERIFPQHSRLFLLLCPLAQTNMPYSIKGYSSDSLARYPSSWKLKPLMPDKPSS